MTLFGIDISHHNGGIDLREVSQRASETPISFVMAKMTEGQGYQDPRFEEYRAQAMDTDLLFAGYHFLRGDSMPGDQARNVRNVIGDSEVPVIIDIERTNGVPQPTMKDVRAFRTSLEGMGVRVANLLYLPQWYWTEIGRPDVGGWDLWQSAYGNNDGVYPGDLHTRWLTMGRQAAVLQFTSAGRVPGYSGNLDINAFRGTRAELAQKGWFIDYKEHEVATKAEIQAWVASTPIVVDGEGNTLPLQRVLRQILNKVGVGVGPSADEIAAKVVAALPEDDDLTRNDVKQALVDVLRSGVGE